MKDGARRGMTSRVTGVAILTRRGEGTAGRKKVVLLLVLPVAVAWVMATLVRQFFSSGVMIVAGGPGSKLLSTMMEPYDPPRGKKQDATSSIAVPSTSSDRTPTSVDVVCRPSGRRLNSSSWNEFETLCLRPLAAKLARAWTSRPKSTWCPPQSAPRSPPVDDNSSASPFGTAAASGGGGGGGEGIVLVKVPKSASSTMAGMALHAASATGCYVEWGHARASESPTLQRLATPASPGHLRSSWFLLIAPIREPFQRALSDVYYHHVSLGSGHKKSPQDAFVIRRLDRVPSNFVLRYVSVHPWRNESGTGPRGDAISTAFEHHHEPFRIPQGLVEHVQEAVNLYDYWVVVDRFVESVVVLANLTGVSFHDYVTMPSKVGGSYYRASPTKCVALVPPDLTPRILEHARTAWNRRNVGDWLLYHVANASLDLTIDSIGRDWVTRQVQDVRDFQEHLRMACANETHFPCSASGQVQAQLSKESCYARDFGCGHACVRRESQLWPTKSYS